MNPLSFLNNLFGGASQQIPTALQNPADYNELMRQQQVYERQIAPWMRAGRQSPMDQVRFESFAPPPDQGQNMVMNPAQAAQQQNMLKQYTMNNMARAPMNPQPESKTFPVEMPKPAEMEPLSTGSFNEVFDPEGETPMLSQMIDLLKGNGGQPFSNKFPMQSPIPFSPDMQKSPDQPGYKSPNTTLSGLLGNL